MKMPRKIRKALGIGPLQKLRHLRVFLNRWLFLEYWFPHVPLSLAMAALGLLQLVPAAEETLGTSLFSGHLSAALHNYKYSGIHNMPLVALGSAMVLMSVGLLFRSRLAWLIAIMVTSTSLVLVGMPKGTPIPALAITPCFSFCSFSAVADSIRAAWLQPPFSPWPVPFFSSPTR